MPKRTTAADVEAATRKLMTAAHGGDRTSGKSPLTKEDFEKAYQAQVRLTESKLRAIRSA